MFSVSADRASSNAEAILGVGAGASAPASPQWDGEQKPVLTEIQSRSGVCLVKYWVHEKSPMETVFQVPQLKRPSAITVSLVTEKRIGESAEQQIFSLYSFLLYSKQFWVR